MFWSRQSAIAMEIRYTIIANIYQCLPITDRFGRRWALTLATIIYIAGVLGQGLNGGNLSGLYASRFISGIGIGATTVIPPMYIAEVCIFLFAIFHLLDKQIIHELRLDCPKGHSRSLDSSICSMPTTRRCLRLLHQLWHHESICWVRQTVDVTYPVAVTPSCDLGFWYFSLSRVTTLALVHRTARASNLHHFKAAPSPYRSSSSSSRGFHDGGKNSP